LKRTKAAAPSASSFSQASVELIEAARICQQDLNEVIAAFVQDKTTIERGLFDDELVPEELTQVRMGKIVKDKYPELQDRRLSCPTWRQAAGEREEQRRCR
jgi:hypothetical protein